MASPNTPSPYHCPRCQTPMLQGQAGGVTLHGCLTCGGVWLNAECARRFSQELPKPAVKMATTHASRASERVDTAANIACPVCGTTMQRTHATAAKLDIDFCTVHGTWYDRHELSRVARAISNSRWGQTTSTDDEASSNPKKKKKNKTKSDSAAGDTVGMVIEGAGAAIDVVDVADAGSDIVGGIFSALGSVFD